MPINLYEHQKEAIENLHSGSVLKGGVGSGKSITAVAYYYLKICEGKIKINGEGGFAPMKKPRDLYVITTAAKRDTCDWERECARFMITKDRSSSVSRVKLTVDSWNNVKKYVGISDAFFIFDEQKASGYGTWAKSFIAIAKKNKWILLSATPGDTWIDYAAVFIANGFYKNITEFRVKHVIYDRFAKYPKIDRYINCDILMKNRDKILVQMDFKRPTVSHMIDVKCRYNSKIMRRVMVERWNVYEEKPIKNVSELCFLMRKVANSDKSRLEEVKKILAKRNKVIIFYNFGYELDILRTLSEYCTVAERNGGNHDPIPDTDSWVYLVQYNAGAEAWNCIKADTIIFYSMNYSYRIMEQARGRIDRLNTPFSDLYYYNLTSNSVIDLAIAKALKNKKDFNENRYMDI